MFAKKLRENLALGPFAERLPLYIMLPGLIIQIVFVALLRRDAFELSQQNQYIFYGLIALEYVWVAINIKRFRFHLIRVHPVVLIGSVMIIQGVLMGLAWSNGMTRIMIDTVNVAVVILNVIYFSSDRAFKGFNFDRLEFKAQIFSVSMIVIGFGAKVVNAKATISLGAAAPSGVAYAILLAGIIVGRKRPHQTMRILVALFVLLATLPNWNRTTLAVIAVAGMLYWLKTVSVRPVRSLAAILAAALIGYFAIGLFPEDSRLAQRINGLENVDLSTTTGSIGERTAEWEAIQAKIDWLGPYAIMLGAGHGAVYDVQYTWKMVTNYSNAHYGWSLFYLRWGIMGYLYLASWAVLLLIAAAKNVLTNRPEVMMVALLSITGLGYLGTYAYFTFFIAGLTFAPFRFHAIEKKRPSSFYHSSRPMLNGSKFRQFRNANPSDAPQYKKQL